jgi:hypothetical protein
MTVVEISTYITQTSATYSLTTPRLYNHAGIYILVDINHTILKGLSLYFSFRPYLTFTMDADCSGHSVNPQTMTSIPRLLSRLPKRQCNRRVVDIRGVCTWSIAQPASRSSMVCPILIYRHSGDEYILQEMDTRLIHCQCKAICPRDSDLRIESPGQPAIYIQYLTSRTANILTRCARTSWFRG